jgi:alpha-amylase/alpha-mannosidase (GH57 family)
MFTLFVKVPTVSSLIKKLKLNKLNKLEKLEKEQSIIMIFTKNLEALNASYHKIYSNKKNYNEIKNSFEKVLKNSREIIKNIDKENE